MPHNIALNSHEKKEKFVKKFIEETKNNKDYVMSINAVRALRNTDLATLFQRNIWAKLKQKKLF